jgi:hypothetical protein
MKGETLMIRISNRFAAATTLLLTMCLAPRPLAAQQAGTYVRDGLPLSPVEARGLIEELSGEIAMHHVREISQFHRIQASSMMRESAAYVVEQLQRYGFQDAQMESFLSDGRKAYQTWLSPVGWTIDEAELWMVAPDRRRLARFSEIANSLVTLSASADEQGFLVDAGTGLDPAFYDSVDVRGKIVLASGYGGEVHRRAVIRHGALGVVCWNDNPDYPDQVRYTGMWPKAGEREQIRWGFNLSYLDGQDLKSQLAEGQQVRLHARVINGDLRDGALDVVTATIPGARYPDREIVLMAHLDHPKPSANDNASGSAALLDLARGLNRLVADGVLDPPSLTIRFLWVAEMYGTAAWLDAHPDVARRTAFGINLDMVGSPPAQSVLQVIQAPASASSILDHVVAEAAHWVAGLSVHEPRGTSGPMNYRVVPYSGGSDHYMFIDGAIRVPSVMLNNWPDPYYHSNEDTPDKIDPTSLMRAELISAATAWVLATMEPDEADMVLQGAVARGIQRLEERQRLVVEMLEELNPQMDDPEIALRVNDAAAILEAQLDLEMRATGSMMRLAGSGADSLDLSQLQSAVTRARARLEAHGEVTSYRVMNTELNRIAMTRQMVPLPQLLPIAMLPERDAARGLVLQRTTRGPISDDWFLDHLPASRRSYYLDGAGRSLWGNSMLRYEIVNFVDGTRNAIEIRNAASAEFGFLSLDEITAFLQDLEAAGLLTSSVGGLGRRP